MRAICAVLLSSVPCWLGFRLAAEERQHTSVLQGILDLILHIRYEISSFRTRRRELFSAFACESLEQCGFLPALRAASALGEENPLLFALKEHGDLLNLSRECQKRLEEFAAHLGECDAREETERCTRLYEALSEMLAKQRAEMQNRVRLYRAFGVVAAGAILLFVW